MFWIHSKNASTCYNTNSKNNANIQKIWLIIYILYDNRKIALYIQTNQHQPSAPIMTKFIHI